MSASTKLVDKLEGVENFRAWKYKIGLILEENDLTKFIKENVPEPEEEVAKEKYKKDMIKGQRKGKYFSSYQCYHCDKMGHIAKNCPARREEFKKRNNKRHHAHATEDIEPPKKLTKEEIEDYVL
jgi:hypothetical protein